MRVFNFSAGPAVLPQPVLEQARDELLEWQDGMSVMEVSHRSKGFIAVAEQAESDLRLGIEVIDEHSRRVTFDALTPSGIALLQAACKGRATA